MKEKDGNKNKQRGRRGAEERETGREEEEEVCQLAYKSQRAKLDPT